MKKSSRLVICWNTRNPRQPRRGLSIFRGPKIAFGTFKSISCRPTTALRSLRKIFRTNRMANEAPPQTDPGAIYHVMARGNARQEEAKEEARKDMQSRL